MTDTASPHTRGLARSLCAHSSLVDVPHPDEPGVRVVGFKYLEAQAGMGEALRALTVVRDAFKVTSKSPDVDYREWPGTVPDHVSGKR